MNINKLFKLSLFKSRYTTYQYVKDDVDVKQVPITEKIKNTNYEKEQWERGGDTVDMYLTVPTGRFNTYHIKYQLWVKYHKKTGLPKYKKVYL